MNQSNNPTRNSIELAELLYFAAAAAYTKAVEDQRPTEILIAMRNTMDIHEAKYERLAA